MNVPKLNEREKALEDEYIRKREQEKFTSKVPKPGDSSAPQQTSQGNQVSGGQK